MVGGIGDLNRTGQTGDKQGGTQETGISVPSAGGSVDTTSLPELGQSPPLSGGLGWFSTNQALKLGRGRAKASKIQDRV
jgi:hypothetical protein